MTPLPFTKKAKKMKLEIADGWEYEDDAQGKWKVKTQRNGVKIRLLREPSDEYKKKIAARKVESQKREAERKVKQDREKLINDKMRELAIKQLEKEGKL